MARTFATRRHPNRRRRRDRLPGQQPAPRTRIGDPHLMAEPEYTVTVTIATVDPALAEYARNEGASLVRLVEELASRGDARTLTHTGVETATDLDPMATLVDQLATAVADELERRERERSPLLFLRSCPFCTEPVERHQRTPEGGVVCPTVEGAPQP